MNWYRKVMTQYVDFSGRARRKEYWMYFLVYFLITLLCGVVEGIFSITGTITTVVALVHLLPSLGVTVRRLHDINRSGWWILVSLIPVIGWLVLLYFMVKSGDTQSNQFGADPKTV